MNAAELAEALAALVETGAQALKLENDSMRLQVQALQADPLNVENDRVQHELGVLNLERNALRSEKAQLTKDLRGALGNVERLEGELATATEALAESHALINELRG